MLSKRNSGCQRVVSLHASNSAMAAVVGEYGYKATPDRLSLRRNSSPYNGTTTAVHGMTSLGAWVQDLDWELGAGTRAPIYVTTAASTRSIKYMFSYIGYENNDFSKRVF